MRNIFVEGIQGSGKSTLLNKINKAFPELKVIKEGDYSLVNLAWQTYMDKPDYQKLVDKYPDLKDEILKNTFIEDEKYIITYTKIRTSNWAFYQDAEKFEIYNKRKSFVEMKRIILKRYRNFFLGENESYLFECSFLQNIVEDLILFHCLSDDEIVSFYQELFSLVNDKFLLIYIASDDLESNFNVIRHERVDDNNNEAWFNSMMDYFNNSPYVKKNPTLSLLEHFSHRQLVELRIINEVINDKAIVVKSKNYDIEEIKRMINHKYNRNGKVDFTPFF